MRPEPQSRYVLAIGLIIVLGAYLLWRTIAGASAAQSAAEAALIVLGGVSITVGVAAFGLSALYQARLRQRQMAAVDAASRSRELPSLSGALPVQSQSQTPLALLLPLPQFPIVLLLRPNWWRIVETMGLVVILVEWLGGSLLLLMGNSLHDALLYPVAALVVFAPASFLFAANEARQTVEVSKHKLVVMGSDRRSARTIHFAEARLFALRPPGKRGTTPVCYELASPNNIVRIVRVRRRMPFIPWLLTTNTRPTIPFDEYDTLMEWLMSYISEQTHLPLVDLR